jgi:hypothetical protein
VTLSKNDTQQNNTAINYVEGCFQFIVLVNDILLSVILLSVVVLSVIMLNVIMLSVAGPYSHVKAETWTFDLPTIA